LFDVLVVQVMVVKTNVARACQGEDAETRALWQMAVIGTAAADVRQRRCAALPITRFEPFEMPGR
jgi:hypothetical protein